MKKSSICFRHKIYEIMDEIMIRSLYRVFVFII